MKRSRVSFDEIGLTRGELLYRLLKRCDRRSEYECWEWIGKVDHGYGVMQFQTKDKRIVKKRAHVVSLYAFTGQYSDTLFVLHSCDNTSCVNPRHLRLGDARDNFIDALTRGRRPKNGPDRSLEMWDEIARLYKEGFSQREIAAKTGRKSKSFIAKVIKELNIPPIHVNKLRRFDEVTRMEAVRRVLSGETPSQVARSIGLKKSNTVLYWLKTRK